SEAAQIPPSSASDCHRRISRVLLGDEGLLEGAIWNRRVHFPSLISSELVRPLLNKRNRCRQRGAFWWTNRCHFRESHHASRRSLTSLEQSTAACVGLRRTR